MMDEEAGGAQSLFLVVDYDFHYGKCPYFCSILQLDMSNEGNSHENQVIETKFSVTFCYPQPQPHSADEIIWSCSPLSISDDLLYMVPEIFGKENEQHVSLHGCIYNLRNTNCKQINPPNAPKHGGCVVSMKGHLYFMAHPREEYLSTPVFERHDPSSDCWEPLQPFPHHGPILATAVLDDTILFNIEGHNICAYFVPDNKWCPVILEQDLPYCISGQAVVLGNTVYALDERCFNVVLRYSVGREEIDDDHLVFRFSLVSAMLVSDMKEIEDEDKNVHWPSDLRNLAYLGNHNFCLVQNCELNSPKEYQRIQVINMKLLEGENLMTVTNTRFYKLKIEGNAQFFVRRCFSSLLNCTTNAVEEIKPSVVEFNPFPKHTGLKQKRKREGKGEDNTDCHGSVENTEVLNHEASPLQTQTQATPTPACPAIPAYHYPRAPAIPPPPPYYLHPAYHYPQVPAIPSPPPYYQHPDYHYPQAPAIPYDYHYPHYPQAPAIPYQHPAYHYPQAPAIPSPPPYYTAPKTNNEGPANQDYCQLCGFQGHLATNCSTYTYHKRLPGSPRSTTLNPLVQEEKTAEGRSIFLGCSNLG